MAVTMVTQNDLSGPSAPGARDLWVFAYGSLMWRPGFPFAERAYAALAGYRRDMCFLSIHYRGTPERPGLVCGLMPQDGALCHGVAYRVAPADAASVIGYLDARELITDIYLPRDLAVTLADGREVLARAYVAKTTHAQFVGGWDDTRKAAAIVAASGSEGRAYDYLSNIVGHLHEMAIVDPHLDDIWAEVRKVNGAL